MEVLIIFHSKYHSHHVRLIFCLAINSSMLIAFFNSVWKTPSPGITDLFQQRLTAFAKKIIRFTHKMPLRQQRTQSLTFATTLK